MYTSQRLSLSKIRFLRKKQQKPVLNIYSSDIEYNNNKSKMIIIKDKEDFWSSDNRAIYYR